MGVAMGGALKCIVKEFCVTMFWGIHTIWSITKQFFLICPKCEGKVAS